MRKIVILLTLSIFLQGCVSPKTGQLSFSLPKNISYPSALVIKDKYLGVLSMEGKFDPLYKVNGKFNGKESEYFIVENNFLLFTFYSLWKLDISSKKLLCLITNIQCEDAYDFSISSDKNYVIFNNSEALGFLNEDVFYSLEEQKEIKVPRIDGLTYKQFFETSKKNQFLLVYSTQNKDEKKVFQQLYLWDIKNKSIKNIEFPKLVGYHFQKITLINAQNRYIIEMDRSYIEQEKYGFRAFSYILDLSVCKTQLIGSSKGYEKYLELNITGVKKIMYYFEDYNLYQCDLETEKIEKLMTSKIKSDFYSIDFNESQYLLVSFDTKSYRQDSNKNYRIVLEHDYYLVSPNKKCIKLSQRFRNYRIRNCKLTKKNKLVIILEDERSNDHQIVLLDPITDKIKALFEVKNKKIDFYDIIDLNDQSSDYVGFRYNEDYVNFNVGTISKIETYYVLNFNTLEMKEIKEISDENFITWFYSFKNSIWYASRNYLIGSYKNVETLYQLDWNDPEKLVPINSSEFMGNSINHL